ncbi:unnamed protein product, partial [marine sediment metagenome]
RLFNIWKQAMTGISESVINAYRILPLIFYFILPEELRK